jgi:hypothetical protein
MADIAVAVAGKIDIVESIQQMTLPCTEAVVAGAPVRIHTDGKWTNANGTSTTENDLWGIATNSAAAGEPVTAVRRGVLDGFTFSQAFNAAIYVSDTDGRLADAAGTASKIVGRVIPAWSQRTGTAADKILSVEL